MKSLEEQKQGLINQAARQRQESGYYWRQLTQSTPWLRYGFLQRNGLLQVALGVLAAAGITLFLKKRFLKGMLGNKFQIWSKMIRIGLGVGSLIRGLIRRKKTKILDYPDTSKEKGQL